MIIFVVENYLMISYPNAKINIGLDILNRIRLWRHITNDKNFDALEVDVKICLNGVELDSLESISGITQCAEACLQTPFCMFLNHHTNNTCVLMVIKNYFLRFSRFKPVDRSYQNNAQRLRKNSIYHYNFSSF